ncbi:hypothetical protein PAMP_009400 [Pampus punctatissimus]
MGLRGLNLQSQDGTIIMRKHQNHARELVRKADLSQWDALVIMSGDGLLFEVINGLMEREDWQEAIQTPLGILPGGSGNALAASVHHYSQLTGHITPQEGRETVEQTGTASLCSTRSFQAADKSQRNDVMSLETRHIMSDFNPECSYETNQPIVYSGCHLPLLVVC